MSYQTFKMVKNIKVHITRMIAFASVERKLIQAMFTSNDALRKWKIRFSIFVGFPNVVTEIEKGRQ